MRTPTWGEIREFLRIDDWEPDRNTGHDHFIKVLLDGSELRTHVSFADDKTMSADRFAFICRTQLQVATDDFWEALRLRRAAPRPSAVEPPPSTAIPAWAARVLVHDLHLTEAELGELTADDAVKRVHRYWAERGP